MLQLLAMLPLTNENGLARTPPLGWRSWNLYGANVNQTLIEGIMDGMMRKDRTVDGVPTSLCDLGYCDVGLDDNWQQCSTTRGGLQFHDEDGTPLVNTSECVLTPPWWHVSTIEHTLFFCLSSGVPRWRGRSLTSRRRILSPVAARSGIRLGSVTLQYPLMRTIEKRKKWRWAYLTSLSP